MTHMPIPIAQKMRAIGIRCPYCHSRRVKAAKNRAMSDMMKEITYICQIPNCSLVFVASPEVLRTSTLSSSPNPEVRIELSQHGRQYAARQLAHY